MKKNWFFRELKMDLPPPFWNLYFIKSVLLSRVYLYSVFYNTRCFKSPIYAVLTLQMSDCQQRHFLATELWRINDAVQCKHFFYRCTIITWGPFTVFYTLASANVRFYYHWQIGAFYLLESECLSRAMSMFAWCHALPSWPNQHFLHCSSVAQVRIWKSRLFWLNVFQVYSIHKS